MNIPYLAVAILLHFQTAGVFPVAVPEIVLIPGWSDNHPSNLPRTARLDGNKNLASSLIPEKDIGMSSRQGILPVDANNDISLLDIEIWVGQR
jgi:hypothetical protein